MKIGYVLLDGCADRPHPALNYTTPLEAARTPNLDLLSARSRLGMVTTVAKGVAPESDIAVFNMLGYSFSEGYPGRGVIEAVGAGVPFKDGDLALRANFATARGRAIVDRRAGRDLSQAEAQALTAELAEIRLTGAEFVFKPTVGYRGVLVMRPDKPLSAEVSNTDPAYSRVGGFGAAKPTSQGEKILLSKALGPSEAGSRAALLVNEFTEKSLKVLGASETNAARQAGGKLPANCILLRDAGDHLPKVEKFEEKYGMKGTAIVEMPAEVGIAKVLGMKMVSVADRNDMKAKAALFAKELKDGTVVYVHIKGPDEFGHDGDVVGKKKSVEVIDREFFSTVQAEAGTTIAVSSDHATPCAIKMHSADPVPLLVSSKVKHDGMRFTERNARMGSLGRVAGRDVLALAMKVGARG